MPTLAATALLDRMSAKRADKDWVDAQRNAETARFLVLCDLKPVIEPGPDRSSGKLKWLSRGEVTRLRLPEDGALFLGLARDTGVPHFAVSVSDHRVRTIAGAVEALRPAIDLRSLAMQGTLDPEEQSLAGKARALAQWHENARCCGKCGSTTIVKDGGWRRKCWGCGLDWFPRTDPVVIMLVTDGERCIMAHEHRYAPGMYSTLAGFLEPGEDIEHAVRREVSQPWPFPHSLMLGFHAEWASGDINIDPKEIVDAQWFHRDSLPNIPPRISIARKLIDAWLAGEV